MNDTLRPSPHRVFIVEDGDDTRLVLTRLFRAMGYEVQAAATMQEALRHFDLSPTDVLLSDIGLPDGNGWTLLRELHQSGQRPFAIAMSGFGTLEDRHASRDAGYRHHLVKPIDLAMLEALLEEAKREMGEQQ